MKELREVLNILGSISSGDISRFHDDVSILAAILLAHEARKIGEYDGLSFDYFIITEKHQYQVFLSYFQAQLSMGYYRCHIYFKEQCSGHWYLIELIKTGSRILIGQFDSNCQTEPVSFVSELLRLLPSSIFSACDFGTRHKTGSGCSIFALDMSFKIECLPNGLLQIPRRDVTARALRNTHVRDPILYDDSILGVKIGSKEEVHTLGEYLGKHSNFFSPREPFINLSCAHKLISWAQKTVDVFLEIEREINDIEVFWRAYFARKTMPPRERKPHSSFLEQCEHYTRVFRCYQNTCVLL